MFEEQEKEERWWFRSSPAGVLSLQYSPVSSTSLNCPFNVLFPLHRELDTAMERRLEEMERRLKDHMDRRLDALEQKLERALMSALPLLTTNGVGIAPTAQIPASDVANG